MIRLTREQSRRVDVLAAEKFHMPGIVLMENAARSAAEVCLRLLDADGKARAPANVLIVCGNGNNGGDGLALARHLHNRGVSVTIALASGNPGGVQSVSAKYPADAKVNWEIVRAMGLPVEKAEKSVLARSDTDLIVDAIFGTGLSSPPRDWFAALADAINSARATGKKVLAIDIPSGLDCDTGRALGPCVRATMTVTFVAEKVGFAAAGAEEYLGQIVVGDIGCPRELVEMALRGD